ncbi:MAG: hypothetical protein RR336_04255, partial [Oscillospiraceae bacterium]
MKKRVLSVLLAGALLLTSGCSSMLHRSLLSVEPHAEHVPPGNGTSVLRAESYPGLVSAVQLCVSQGLETGEIQLYNYTRDPDKDLTAACLAVVQTDPLAAYAVDYMKHDVTRILSYYKVNLTIQYRRTPEQIAGIVTATGGSAIRGELVHTLADFQSETVLRISDFAEDDTYIEQLLRRAYLDAPAAALGEPTHTVTTYPETGKQRIVEILLTYPDDVAELKTKSARVQTLAKKIADEATSEGTENLAGRLYATLKKRALFVKNPEGGSTAYAALVDGKADSLGMALAWKLLCDAAEIPCTVVEGLDKDGTPRYWTIVTRAEGPRHVDPTRSVLELFTDAQRAEQGYTWPQGIYPLCGDPIPAPIP